MIRARVARLLPAILLAGAATTAGVVSSADVVGADEPAVVRDIAGYVDGLRWALAPANKVEATALLANRLKLDPDVAARTYELAANPEGGLAPDARFDPEGFRNVLALRAELEGQWNGAPPPIEKYVDLTYHRRALESLSR